MKAALLHDYHQQLELVDRPVPELTRPDQVLIRIAGAGVCATDLHAIEGLMEPAGMDVPRVLGHENAGYVETAGDLVSTVAEGDAVVVYPPHSCGLCVPCRRGNDMHCERHEFVGLSVDGGFAEYLAVPERSLVKLPDGVDPVEVAPHADAGLTAYHAVHRLVPLLVPGSTTVVIGIGGVGHIALQLLRELGSSELIAIDPNPGRRELALELGADHAIDSSAGSEAVRELTGGAGAGVVLDIVGSDDTHAGGMEMLARGGTYSMIGYGGTFSAPSGAMVGQEQAAIANLVGRWTDLWELMQMHGAGRITLKTETHPLEEINEVLGRLAEGEITGRAVMLPNGDRPA
jgi:NAD+-dependent secondary alcohol dehydrogenase Adh1